MGSLKRKNPTLLLSPAPSKRPSRDESAASLPANGCPGRRADDGSATPDPQSNGNNLSPSVVRTDDLSSEAGLPCSEYDAKSQDEEEVAAKDTRPREDRKGEEAGTGEQIASTNTGPLIPNHAGWFSWDKIHALERRGLPEFFNSKSKLKTPPLYMEYRNLLMKKSLENPEKLFPLADVSRVISDNKEAHREAAKRVFEFLDHWGLINSRSLVGQKGETSIKQSIPMGDETTNPVRRSLTSQLYRFDSPCASSTSKPCPTSAKAIAATTVAETTTIAELQGAVQGPAVEYHCNFCSADCSKRRFHCQKQVDFDLCPECYNEDKFSFGMIKTDFILMEALSEANDNGSGGWTDQETLLLLEALELYGDNFSEIADHVATKTKAQCILHFIRLPIEDPFLEAMESSSNLSNLQLGTDAINGNKNSNSFGQVDDQDGVAKNQSSDMVQQKVSEEDTVSGILKQEETKVDVGLEDNNSIVTSALIAAAQAAGLSGPDKTVAFSECGNPVMALVAFLGALVGPDVAAGSAQAALNVLSGQASALQLADKNSFNLEAECPIKDEDTLPHDGPLEGAMQSDSHSITKNMSYSIGADNICADEARIGRSSSLGKIKDAAATTLAAAAVKAKFLADQEEWEILRLAGKVVDSQLKKTQIKLKLFKELEVMLDRERDLLEKSRQRLILDRAQLTATRAVHSASGHSAGLNGAGSLGSKLSHSLLGASSGFASVTPMAVTPPFTAPGQNDSLRVLSVPQFRDPHGASNLPMRPVSFANASQFPSQSEIQRSTLGLTRSK